jgi:hypothetical protein
MINGVLNELLSVEPTPAAKSLLALTSDTIVSEADSVAVTWNVTRTDVLIGVPADSGTATAF